MTSPALGSTSWLHATQWLYYSLPVPGDEKNSQNMMLPPSFTVRICDEWSLVSTDMTLESSVFVVSDQRMVFLMV